jgi:hypothetical protein
VVVPPIAIAEVIRGGAPDAAVNALLKTVFTSFIGAGLARRAGELLGRLPAAGVGDALVAVEAMRGSSVVLTSDPADLRALIAAGAASSRVRVEAV